MWKIVDFILLSLSFLSAINQNKGWFLRKFEFSIFKYDCFQLLSMIEFYRNGLIANN